MTKPPTQPPVITLAPGKVAQLKRHGKITGRPLRHSVAIETRYVSDLVKLVNQMTAQVERAVLPILREAEKEQGTTDGFTLDAISDDQKAANKKAASKAAAAIKKLQATFASMFANRAHKIADGMFAAVTAESGAALNGTLSEMAGKLTVGMGFMDAPVGEIVRGGIAENIALIKSIPAQYMARVSGDLEAAALAGNNMTGLIGKIQAASGITKRRAKNIALDQTRKAYNTINGARMAAAGVTKFEWVHSGGGQRPRHHHITPWPAGLNGGIFDLANPPIIDQDTGERGLPGQAINCKCTMAPVIEMEGAGNEADYTDAPIDYTGPEYAPAPVAKAAKPSAAIVQKPAIAPAPVLAQAPSMVAANVTRQQKKITASENLKAKQEKEVVENAPFIAASEIEPRQEKPRQLEARQLKPRK